jgi:hypothetical protein
VGKWGNLGANPPSSLVAPPLVMAPTIVYIYIEGAHPM